MTPPLVSIGLTVYNAEDTLERALESAVRQTWNNIEIVAIDDCSSDGSFDLLLRLEKQIPELRVFQNTMNSGVAFSRNQIVEKARGEFIVFFDDDDVSLPTRVEVQQNRIVAYERDFAPSSPVICHTSRQVEYPDRQVRIEGTMGVSEVSVAPNGLAVAERILYGKHLKGGYGSCATCSQMARTSVYRSLKGFDENLRRGEDTEFNVRLSLQGGHFVGVEAPLVHQYMTKTSEKSLTDEYMYMRYILEKHRDIGDSESTYQFSLAWLGLKHKFLEKRFGSFLVGFVFLAMTNPVKTLKRAALSFPSVGVNLAFSRFHGRK